MATADSLVTLDRVAVGYRNHLVLSNLSLQLARGSFTALLGANGSGKTTLLKTLAGILPPLSGEVRYAPVNAVAGQVLNPNSEKMN